MNINFKYTIRMLNSLHLLGGGAGLIGLIVSLNFPGPASLTAATLNSYGRPSIKPFTCNCVPGTSFKDALQNSVIVNTYTQFVLHIRRRQ